MSNSIQKVVLAYSGGLDTSVMVHWLRENYGCEVICMTADVGQAEELDGLEEKAYKTGAAGFHLVDLKEDFAKNFVLPAIKANAIYEGYYLLGTSLARPCIGKALVDVAVKEGAQAIAHGATGKGNDQVRFELSAYSLHPEIQVIAPWREWKLKSREQLMAFCKERDIPVAATAEKPYSMDRNLMHISYEGGILEEPWNAPTEDMFLLTTSPEKAPDEPEYVEIDYVDGTPVAINGQKMSPVELIDAANKIGGRHGIGRVDIVENRYVGIKSRGVYETPGVTLLHRGHHAVESITLDREVLRLRDSLVPKYTELVYNGFWFSPEMELMLKFMNDIQTGVSGTARLKLFKGSAQIVGRKAKNSLYSHEHATFGEDTVYDQHDAEGFIKIVGERKYDEVLGVHIIGPKATELIAESVVALNLEATGESLAASIHPHPTLSEAMGEAAHALATGQPIHF
ncbi:MAG: argininosuccinate synthase [Myxococcales bacterium]|nr:argininosuccinate synthase [Myxococcales bacterium]